MICMSAFTDHNADQSGLPLLGVWPVDCDSQRLLLFPVTSANSQKNLFVSMAIEDLHEVDERL